MCSCVMPDKANPSARSVKKRKTKESRDGCDSSFVSARRASSEELHLKRSHEHHGDNEKSMPTLNLQSPVKDPPKHQLCLTAPTEKSLKEHMESILSEVKEAREKLFQWWRQEIQTIVGAAGQRTVPDTDAEKKKKERDECGVSRDFASVQAMPKGGQTGEKISQDACKLEPGKHYITLDASKQHAHNNNDRSKKSGESLSTDCKHVVVDVAIDSEPGAMRKLVNALDQGNASGKSGRKADVPAHNMIPPESKSLIFDMCLGAELGGDSKEIEGLDGTLDSGVTMRGGFEFNKANHEMQKGLDNLERLRETKSDLLDMGFDDEESNEGNGVGCSLESAASSKVNSGFSKASAGVLNGFKGFDAGLSAGFGEQCRFQLGSDGVPEGAASSADAYGSIKVKKEVIFEERKYAAVKDGVVNSIRGGRLDDQTRQIDQLMGGKPGHAFLKGSHIGGGSLAEASQPNTAQQQLGMGARSGCGIKRSYATAMTFKGSALECKNDVFQQANTSFADGFNSATSTILVVKEPVQLLAGDKGGVESSALPSETDTLGVTGAAPSSWNMFTASKNAINQTLQESKAAHLEYASRSKLGDAIVGSGRTVDFPGFDPLLGYTSHFKAGTEMMDAYQQERANASSMYFSSLCTNNSVYLPNSNRGMSVQPSTPSTSPSTGSVSRSMLMGIPGHLGGHRDPSNMHTFLGLGMNGAPAVGNGMQVFSGLYLQNNQQHNQAPYKNPAQSTSPMVSHQGNSAAHEKAILELNF